MRTEFAGHLGAKRSQWDIRRRQLTIKEFQKAKDSVYSTLYHYHPRLMGMYDMRPWQEALKDYLVARGHIA